MLRSDHCAIIAHISAFAWFHTGCTGFSDDAPIEEVSFVEQKTQCGTSWDAIDVEHYQGSHPVFSEAYVARYQGAFGRHCSGTLVGPDLFVTVKHSTCGATPGESVGFNCQLSADYPVPDPEDQDAVVAAAAAQARCEWFSVAEYWESPNHDATVSRLNGNPGRKYGFVIPTTRPLSVGEDLAMFQHPIGPSNTVRRRKQVGFGTVYGTSGSNVSHRIDTTGGSSGAGILDARGLLVAVHRASGCGASGGTNSATTITQFIDDFPQIRGLLTAIWTVSL